MATHYAPADAPPGPRYLKVREVAAELNLGVRTVYELIAAGKLTAVPMGTGRGTLRVTREELDRYEREIRGEVGQ